MGQTISSVANPDGPLMRLKVEITCDGDHLPHVSPGHFVAVGDNLIVLRNRATVLGWRKISGGSWRGPCCKA